MQIAWTLPDPDSSRQFGSVLKRETSQRGRTSEMISMRGCT